MSQQDSKNSAKPARNYGLILDRRDHIALTGVSDVLSFDEQEIVLRTEGGQLVISGSGLHVARLMLEEGQLVVDGQVDSLVYQEGRAAKKGGSLVSRMFR